LQGLQLVSGYHNLVPRHEVGVISNFALINGRHVNRDRREHAIGTAALAQLVGEQSGIGSGFDNASRNVKLPKKSLPTLSPSTAETTQNNRTA